MSSENLNAPVNIIIAEDQVMMAEGLSAVLEKEDKYKVIGISPNGEHLLHSLNNLKPDVILLDLNMPVMDGFKACAVIREKFPDIIVVALTMYNNEKIIKQVKEAGAAGMLLKFSSSAELLKKLNEVLTHTEKNKFVTSDNAGKTGSDVIPPEYDDFLLKFNVSERELEIMRLVAQGLQTEEIAQKLFLSAHTVTTHRRNILTKLNLNNAVELINFMHKHSLL